MTLNPKAEAKHLGPGLDFDKSIHHLNRGPFSPSPAAVISLHVMDLVEMRQVTSILPSKAMQFPVAFSSSSGRAAQLSMQALR
jgi:hypothetical protein